MRLKMFKTLVLVALAVFPTIMYGQKGYKQAIGLRFSSYFSYDVLAASYKKFASEKGALEFNLGFGGRNVYVPGNKAITSFSPGVSLSASYQHHVDIETPTNENLKWFGGGGFTAFGAFSKNNGYEGFGCAIFGTGGIDFSFKDLPINLTADWRPQVFLNAPAAYPILHIGTLGVAARYTF